MSAPEFDSFEDFWPYYVLEHSDKTNRRLHFAGTSAALGTAAYALLSGRYRALLAVPLLGYGAAWVGHFFVQKNKPATFEHPLWSLRGDLVMFAMMLAGNMDEEVARCAEKAAEKVRQEVHDRSDGGQNGAAEKSRPTVSDEAIPAINAAPLN